MGGSPQLYPAQEEKRKPDMSTPPTGLNPDPVAQPQESLRPVGKQSASKEFELDVPFSEYIERFPPVSIEPDYLSAGLASSFTTKIDNPIFKLPTANDERNGAVPAAFAMYAPYYIGTDLTPEQIANDVAGQAAIFLKSLDAQHGFDGYVGRMMSVLRTGHVAHQGLQAIEDRNILLDVHEFLAMITNRLHHIAPRLNPDGQTQSAAEKYRAGTHEIVDPYTKSILYLPASYGYKERFELPQLIRSDPSHLVSLGWDFFDTKQLQRGAEFAALAAEKLGNPLVRSVLSEYYVPPHIRSREYRSAEI